MRDDDMRQDQEIASLLRETRNIPPPSLALKMRILRSLPPSRRPFLAFARHIAEDYASSFSFWSRGALLAASFTLGVVLQNAGITPLPVERDDPFSVLNPSEIFNIVPLDDFLEISEAS